MFRASSLFVPLLTGCAALLVFAPASLSQGLGDPIVNCREDLAAKRVVLSLQSRTPLSAPNLQYLPGPDGSTILVADFAGVSFRLPTKVIRPQHSGGNYETQQGIHEIRIGQFQESPPIFRVAVRAKDPRTFKTISLKADPGELTISWQDDVASANPPERISSRSQSVPFAPLPGKARDRKEVPPIAPATVSLTPHGLLKADGTKLQEPKKTRVQPAVKSAKQEVNKETTRTAPPRGDTPTGTFSNLIARARNALLPPGTQAAVQDDEAQTPAFEKEPVRNNTPNAANTGPASKFMVPINPGLSESASQSTDTVRTPSGNAPTVTLEAASEAAQVSIPVPSNPVFKSFRLHEPERYVIDFESYPDLADANLPTIEDSDGLVKGVRVGVPDDDKKLTRLVLDLKDVSVNVIHKEDAGNKQLLLFVDRSEVAAKGKATIVLDAGHGGNDPGAQRGDVQEKAVTLAIVNKLKQALENKGVRVLMTRSDDSFVSLEDRVKLTNSVTPNLFLSVHINALESTSDIHGIETYFQTEQSKPLADALHQSLVTGLAAPDRNVRKARFYVINHTEVPAVLAEVGYISNKEEREKLISSDYQMKVADALTQGVMLYLSKPVALKSKPAVAAEKSVKPTAQASAAGKDAPAASLAQSASSEQNGIK